jgi:DtxR family Mn-dependent transcriptional regulator
MEDYLEQIYLLQQQDKVARAKDLAERLGLTKGTVTSTLKILSAKGLIEHQPYSYITLTPDGEVLALEVIRRHEVLKDFFGSVLRLEPASAEANACRVEHAVDGDLMDRLVAFLDYLRKCPQVSSDFGAQFEAFFKRGGVGDCARCTVCGLEAKPDK